MVGRKFFGCALIGLRNCRGNVPGMWNMLNFFGPISIGAKWYALPYWCPLYARKSSLQSLFSCRWIHRSSCLTGVSSLTLQLDWHWGCAFSSDDVIVSKQLFTCRKCSIYSDYRRCCCFSSGGVLCGPRLSKETTPNQWWISSVFI